MSSARKSRRGSYAERMARGFGPNIGRELAWTTRDAEAAGNRRRIAVLGAGTPN